MSANDLFWMFCTQNHASIRSGKNFSLGYAHSITVKQSVINITMARTHVFISVNMLFIHGIVLFPAANALPQSLASRHSTLYTGQVVPLRKPQSTDHPSPRVD